MRPLSTDEDRIVSLAADVGYSVSKLRHYQIELVKGDLTVYLDRDRVARGVAAFLVHPESPIDSLNSLNGVVVFPDWRHGTGMARFPRRLHTGQVPIPYGLLAICDDLPSVRRLLSAVSV